MAVTLTTLEPSTAAISDADFTIRCLGTGFDAESVIVWMGADEPTTFVSDTEVTTLVKPSVVSSPTTIAVLVRNGLGEESAPLDFTWTAAVEPPSTNDGGYTDNPQLPPPTDPDDYWRSFMAIATTMVVQHARRGVDFEVSRPSKDEPLDNVYWDEERLGPRPAAEIEQAARDMAVNVPNYGAP